MKVTNGGVGVASVGVETLQEASAICCIGGNFSLSFDGFDVFDVDLENDANAATSAASLVEALGDVTQGKRTTFHEGRITKMLQAYLLFLNRPLQYS